MPAVFAWLSGRLLPVVHIGVISHSSVLLVSRDNGRPNHAGLIDTFHETYLLDFQKVEDEGTHDQVDSHDEH